MKNIKLLTLVILSLLTILFGHYYYTQKLENIASHSKENTVLFEPTETEKEKFSQEDIYVYSNNGEINVYLKGSNVESNRYIGYNIKHLEREMDKTLRASNYNVWKLDGAAEYSRKGQRFNRLTDLVSPGEWDLAIQESGATDFVGGALHGDEITSSVEIFVDGNKIDPYGNSFAQEAKELKVVVESDLFRDNAISDNDVKIAYHYKEYVFDKNGLTVMQDVDFVEQIHLNKSYLAMLPIYRQRDGVQITDVVKTDYNDEEYDVSEAGFDIPEITDVDTKKVEIKGEESGIAATVEIIDRSPTDIPHSFTLSNSDQYNKLYFAFVDQRYTTYVGEKWSQTVHYNIVTNN